MENSRLLKEIWDKFVPPRGQSTVLQGEMLRQLEALRYEAQNNGNINWDTNFTFFCESIFYHLSNSDKIRVDEKLQIETILKECRVLGQIAERFYNETSTKEDLEIIEKKGFAVVDDSQYDIIANYIAQFCLENPTPIPYKLRDDIYR